MEQDNEYRDPIISVFKDESDSVDNAAIRALIEQYTDAGNEPAINNSKIALDLYTEFLKLQYFMEKTWDIKTLETSVIVKFESYDNNDNGSKDSNGSCHDESFYKDIALKCIRNCDKISTRLTNYQNEMTIIRAYINSMQSRIMEDPMTLLLEIWFACNRKLKLLRNKIAGVFLRSKLLIIDHELESFKLHLSDAKIIPSYRSFMKILIEQLNDAEFSKDQSLFDDCLSVFLDIEAMFNSLHLSMLQSQNKSLQDSISGDTTNFDDADTFSTDTLNDHSRSSSVSTSTDLSYMMERTNITKELPNLLNAFNNAKRLEQELENLRTVPHNPTSSVPSVLNGGSRDNEGPNGTFKSKLVMMDQQHNLANHFSSIGCYGKSPLNRGSNILNSLYGTGTVNGVNRH